MMFAGKVFMGGILLVVALVGVVGGILLLKGSLKPSKIEDYQKFKKPAKADDTGFTEQGIKAVVAANNTFAFKLYHSSQLQRQQNLLYSPYSLCSAVAISYEGAAHQTYDEFKHVFQFPDKQQLRPNFAKIYNMINGAMKGCRLRTANAIWLQQDYPVHAAYKSILARYYSSAAVNFDFIHKPEQARKTINKCIAQQTAGKIKNLIAKPLSQDTRFVITNAVYFQGFWKWPFKKSATRDDNFYITPSKAVKVPLMCLVPGEDLRYTETQKLQIVELPYQGDRIVMLILLPKQTKRQAAASLSPVDPQGSEQEQVNYTLEDVTPELTYANVVKWKAKLRKVEMNGIYLPRFKFASSLYLKQVLIAMGLRSPFHNADFSGITSRDKLVIGQVIHQAYIAVDETGTEATAATALTGLAGCAIRRRLILRADHPFIFMIEDRATDTILFLGRVVNPLQTRCQYP